MISSVPESTVRRRVGGDRSEALLLSAFADLAARAGEDQLEQIEALIAQRGAKLGEGA